MVPQPDLGGCGLCKPLGMGALLAASAAAGFKPPVLWAALGQWLFPFLSLGQGHPWVLELRDWHCAPAWALHSPMNSPEVAFHLEDARSGFQATEPIFTSPH